MTAAATIKRGTNKARPAVRRSARGKKPPSMLTRAIGAIPISAALWQRLATVTILTAAGGTILAIAIMLGMPAFVGNQLADGIGRAGFAVKRVEVTGIDRMERLTVYAVALDQNSRAMPLVDLNKVRSQLLQYGWIKDARVSRRLPDTLVVDIVERKAAAVWQHGGQLSLIDAGGIVLEPVALNAMPDLPLVIGPDANVQATALTELMTHAPRLNPMLAGATWVGGRRWDLKFQSGEVLALPEGNRASATALNKFAVMDGKDGFLGKGFIRFDMRDPAKMFVRVGKNKPAIDQPTENAESGPDSETGGEA